MQDEKEQQLQSMVTLCEKTIRIFDELEGLFDTHFEESRKHKELPMIQVDILQNMACLLGYIYILYPEIEPESFENQRLASSYESFKSAFLEVKAAEAANTEASKTEDDTDCEQVIIHRIVVTKPEDEDQDLSSMTVHTVH